MEKSFLFVFSSRFFYFVLFMDSLYGENIINIKVNKL